MEWGQMDLNGMEWNGMEWNEWMDLTGTLRKLKMSFEAKKYLR